MGEIVIGVLLALVAFALLSPILLPICWAILLFFFGIVVYLIGFAWFLLSLPVRLFRWIRDGGE